MKPYAIGADVPILQRAVLRVIGGRPYREQVDPLVRLSLMRGRARGTRQELALASLAAHAVGAYLDDIGEPSAARWYEMSGDLLIVAGSRPSAVDYAKGSSR